jgi:hypothetical protein
MNFSEWSMVCHFFERIFVRKFLSTDQARLSRRKFSGLWNHQIKLHRNRLTNNSRTYVIVVITVFQTTIGQKYYCLKYMSKSGENVQKKRRALSWMIREGKE